MLLATNIYKYVGPDNLEKVFARRDRLTLKSSRPSDFNDPYELFLTIDFNERPEALAFYKDAVGELPQVPTTCFSRSPIVIPMWAHYAKDLSGFAVGFDEARLSKAFPKSGFGNVDYRDSADKHLTDLLYQAYYTGKPRHVHFLRQAIFQAAYYTKAKCWSYEKERRMLIHEKEVRRVKDLILVDVPSECVTAIVCGPRATQDTAAALRNHAARIGCPYFELKIGRSTPVPYLVDGDGRAFTFARAGMVQSVNSCMACKEPLPGDTGRCSWCSISESHIVDAAARNPYRLLQHTGLLEKYIKDVMKIGRQRRKKRLGHES